MRTALPIGKNASFVPPVDLTGERGEVWFLYSAHFDRSCDMGTMGLLWNLAADLGKHVLLICILGFLFLSVF